MNSDFNERRISRIAKETLNGVDENFLLFSDGTYALMPEKYVLEGILNGSLSLVLHYGRFSFEAVYSDN